MHSIDDVHVRGAVMVARACREQGTFGYVYCSGPSVGQPVTGDEDGGALFRALWSGDSLCRLRALNRADAALARVFDEA